MIKLSKIKPNPANPRIIKDNDFIKLCANIKSLPKMMALRPIVVDDNMIIQGGNMRYKALQHLNYKEIPDEWVKKASDFTTDELRQFIVLDNVSFGEWDMDELANNWDHQELEMWGVDVPEFEPEATEDEFAGVAPKEPITVLGDLYEIGAHRLLCGDSTDSEQVGKLMNGEKADMVFTDPPYGIDYSGGRTQVVEMKSYGKLMNDDLQGIELGNLIGNIFIFNKGEADIYICVSPIMQKPFLDFIDRNSKRVDAVIVWDKKQPGLGYMAYRRQCEFILFIKGGDFKKGDVSDFDLWSINRDNAQTYLHGTQKPIAVPSRAINNSSEKGDLVLEYFLGSGSTMVASHQLNRKCYGMELDPKYCDVIVSRMIKLNATLPVKRNGVLLTKYEVQKFVTNTEA